MLVLDDLRQLAEQVKKHVVNVRGEEATKQALVLPFLQAIGYDVYDHDRGAARVRVGFTRCRVYFRSVDDLAPLKALFVAAFEQEAKRKEADVAEAN